MNGDNFVPLFEGLSDYWMPKDPDNGDWSAVNPNAKYPRIYGNRGNSGSNLRQSDLSAHQKHNPILQITQEMGKPDFPESDEGVCQHRKCSNFHFTTFRYRPREN